MMSETKQLLERASRSAPDVAFGLEDVRRRGERRHRDQRIRAGAVGLTLAVVAAALGFIAFHPAADRQTTLGEGPTIDAVLPPATTAALVAGPGESYYRSVLLVSNFHEDDTRLDATYWWSPGDDSGRIDVTQADAYGIDGGRFGPGEFPNWNEIDVSDFPLDPTELTAFLLERSAETGSSPAPMVTPPPEGAPHDGQLWRAITDLLADPHATPEVRAALLDVAAALQGSAVSTDVVDPAGRPAHEIAFGNWAGDLEERLYVDPDTHELLAKTTSSGGAILEIYLVQHAGLADSTETAPEPDGGSVPLTLLSTEDLVAMLGGEG
jgi:hypothetical protein